MGFPSIILTATEESNLLRHFKRAVRWIFQLKKNKITADDLHNPNVKPLLSEINAILQTGMKKGISHSVPERMVRNLSDNIFLFSGAKTYAELKKLSELLLDAQKHIKPFNQFWQDVKSVHNTYNKSYLEAEYLYAVHAAQSAEKWSRFAEDGDRYNLQYRTAYDDKVREEHVPLHDITLPPSHPFWDSYFPPNGWRCRCTVVQVRKGKYPESNSEESMDAGEKATEGKNEIFRFNPGKEQVVFPKHHPYFPEYCANCDRYKLGYGQGEFCKFCNTIRETSYRKSVVETRLDARQWAIENIPKSEPLIITVNKDEFKDISVYRGTVKTFTGKPHKFEKERNLWASDLSGLFNKSTYYGRDDDEIINGKKKHPDVNRWLYYEVKVGNENSYICVKVMENGNFVPYCLDDQMAFDKHKNRIKREKPPK